MRRGIALAWVVACVLFSGTSASAHGFGAYFEYGDGTGETKVKDKDQGPIPPDLVGFPEKVDFDRSLVGLGLLYDTNVAGDKLLNYRIGLGWREASRSDGLGSDDIDGSGLSLTQSLGFGILRHPEYRVWVGPVVRLDIGVYKDFIGDRNLGSISVGAGPQLGINYHLNDRISFTGTFAYQYMALVVDEIDDLSRDDFDFDGLERDGHEHLVSLTIGVMFRTAKDVFE